MARDARIEMLARYYNMKTQSDEQLVNSRVKAISEALERADNDMEFIKAHVDEYAQLLQKISAQ